MRKALFAAAVALMIVPSAGQADVSTQTLETGFVSFGWNDGPDYLYGEVWISSTSDLDPSVDPGSVFPIVIDPNDPPEPPVSATSSTVRASGYVNGCLEVLDEFNDPTYRCFGSNIDEPLTSDEVSFDGVPLPGNAYTFSFDTTIDGPVGEPVPLSLSGSFAKPDDTYIGVCPMCVRVNPWMHEGTTHADIRHSETILSRSGYRGGVSLELDLFEDPILTDAGGYYTLTRETTAGAEI